MNKDNILLLEEHISKILNKENIKLLYCDYEKEGGNNYFRVYIKKDDSSVSLDDCEKVNILISEICEEFITESFILEVSSPGLERKLKKIDDFKIYINSTITVKTISNIENKKSFEGILKAVYNDEIEIQDNNLGIVKIPLSKIKVAKNVYDFKELIGGINES